MAMTPEHPSPAAIAATYGRIAAGSAAGGVARWLAPALFPDWTPELAVVLFVNVAGSFAIGGLAGLAERGRIGERTREALMTGFCGGYTTFSAFSLVTLQLLQAQPVVLGAGYVAISLLLWLGAAWAGHAIFRRGSSP